MFDFFSGGTIHPLLRQLAHHKAHELSHQPGFTPADAPDLEQDLLAKVAERQTTYLPGRGRPEAFARTIVESKSATIARDRRAAKRPPASVASLDQPPAGERLRLIDLLPSAASRTRVRSGEPDLDLQTDLAIVLKSLPSDDQAICGCLMSGTLSDASRELGRPRSTLQKAVARIRRRFEDAGLKIYLGERR